MPAKVGENPAPVRGSVPRSCAVEDGVLLLEGYLREIEQTAIVMRSMTAGTAVSDPIRLCEILRDALGHDAVALVKDLGVPCGEVVVGSSDRALLGLALSSRGYFCTTRRRIPCLEELRRFADGFGVLPRYRSLMSVPFDLQGRGRFALVCVASGRAGFSTDDHLGFQRLVRSVAFALEVAAPIAFGEIPFDAAI